MGVKRPTVTVTTDAGGDATVYLGKQIPGGSVGAITGRILNVIYTKDDFDTGVDFTVTTEKTLQNVWVELNVDASKTVAPSQATHDAAGIAATARDYITLAKERLKIVIANGGDTKSGTFTLILEEV